MLPRVCVMSWRFAVHVLCSSHGVHGNHVPHRASDRAHWRQHWRHRAHPLLRWCVGWGRCLPRSLWRECFLSEMRVCGILVFALCAVGELGDLVAVWTEGVYLWLSRLCTWPWVCCALCGVHLLSVPVRTCTFHLFCGDHCRSGLAGSFGGLSVTLAKSVVELIKAALQGKDSFAHLETYVIIASMAVRHCNRHCRYVCRCVFRCV